VAVLIWIAATVIFFITIYLLIEWTTFNTGNDMKIGFSKFLEWYAITSGEWDFGYISLCKNSRTGSKNIGFSFFDFIKYKSWLRKKKKQDSKNTLENMIRCDNKKYENSIK
jgi:hypothetical protein